MTFDQRVNQEKEKIMKSMEKERLALKKANEAQNNQNTNQS
jgi:hypothetical protein